MKNLNIPNELTKLEALGSGLVEQPERLLGAETVQIILAREIHDFTVLRTEPTRELNTTVTPTSLTDMTPILRVVFLASKQKAVESRAFRSILKTVKSEVGLPDKECYLKDNLCMSCPRCVLFGAVSTEKGAQQEAIKHRINYGSAFSLMPYEDIEAAFTFNAVDEKTQSTGQALGTRFTVSPATIFPSIVTLRCATWKELVMVLKTLLSTTNYGAENRIGGEVRNHVIGIVSGWEELITPLELTLELYEKYTSSGSINVWSNGNTKSDLTTILEKYKEEAVFGDKVQILTDSKLEELIKSVRTFELSKEFLEQLDKDSEKFKNEAKKGGK